VRGHGDGCALLGRLGSAEEVARAVAFLASPARSGKVNFFGV